MTPTDNPVGNMVFLIIIGIYRNAERSGSESGPRLIYNVGDE